MTPCDALNLFGLFLIFLGLGLLLYASLLGIFLRFHLQLFPKIHAKLEQLMNNHEANQGTHHEKAQS